MANELNDMFSSRLLHFLSETLAQLAEIEEICSAKN